MIPIKARKCHVNFILLHCKRDLWVMFKLNYNFVHDVLKKIGLDPNLLQGTTGIEW